ncbi:hypothetical protein PSPO01_04267 [Paraphaeosphaeria sporulosa]
MDKYVDAIGAFTSPEHDILRFGTASSQFMWETCAVLQGLVLDSMMEPIQWHMSLDISLGFTMNTSETIAGAS